MDVGGDGKFSTDLTVGGSLTLGSTAITATADELNILDGVTATAAELNFSDGVTSNIQTQLDARAQLTGATFTGDLLLRKSDGSAVSLSLSRADHPDMSQTFKIQPTYVSATKEALVVMAGSTPIIFFDERERVSIAKTDPDHTLDVGGDGKFSTNLTVGGTLDTGSISSTGAGSIDAADLALPNIAEYADDAAAATGGLAVGKVYRTGSALKIRVS